MTVLQWKKLANFCDKKLLPPETLMASVVHIEAPILDIPPELLKTVESLHSAVHSGEFQGEKITLPPGCMALLYKQGKIESWEGELGKWLQKSPPWERGDFFSVVDMADFPVSCCIPGRKQHGFFIHFQMKVSLKRDGTSIIVRDWLRFHRHLTIEDIGDKVKDCLASMDFLYYTTSALLQNYRKCRQIEKKARSKISGHLDQYGLALKSLDIRGENREEKKEPSSEKRSKSNRAESIVEVIEERRLQQSLQDIGHFDDDTKKIHSRDITARITVNRQAIVEPILPSRPLENKDAPRNLTVKIVESRDEMIVEPILPSRKSEKKRKIPDAKSGKNIEENIESKRSHRMKKMALEETDGN